MYILFDDDGNHFQNDDLQALIAEAKKDGYGSFDCWEIYEAKKLEVVESYSVKTVAAKKPAVKKVVK